jgi:cbb3-type cytochrome oxidase subunit 3
MKPDAIPGDDWVYLVFGLLLCLALLWVTVHYFARKRKASVEAAKYKMLDDDE